MLPDNWRELPSSVLFFQYARQAFRLKNQPIVDLISKEIKDRLIRKGLVHVSSVGWVLPEEIENGMSRGAIVKTTDGQIIAHAEQRNEVVTKKIKGLLVTDIVTKTDLTKFHQWYEKVRERQMRDIDADNRREVKSNEVN